eukprot:SAG22_NODE_503_length_9694_cov_13.573736_5_plen_1203_part_00
MRNERALAAGLSVRTERYNPTEYKARAPFPAGIISYRTASDGGKGDQHMWAIANYLEEHGITCYCGLMVRTANWQEEWFGKMMQAKFAIIMPSTSYWEPRSPCTEEVKSILKCGIPIFTLRVDDSCHTCMRGNFLGESVEQITGAGFLKARLGTLNCFPPPHKPLFQVEFDSNAAELVEMIKADCDWQTRAVITTTSAPAPPSQAGFGAVAAGVGAAALGAPQLRQSQNGITTAAQLAAAEGLEVGDMLANFTDAEITELIGEHRIGVTMRKQIQKDVAAARQAEAQIKSGQGLEQQGRMEEALAEYQAAEAYFQDCNPALTERISVVEADIAAKSQAEAQVTSAQQLEQQGRMEEALAQYQAAEGYFQGARSKLTKRISVIEADIAAKSRAEARMESGQELEQQGHMEEALAEYQAAEEHFRGRNPALAERIVAVRADIAAKSRAEARFTSGRNLQQRGRMEQALAEYQAAEEYFQGRNPALAEQVKVVEVDIAAMIRAEAQIKSAEGYERAGRLEEALADYEAAEVYFRGSTSHQSRSRTLKRQISALQQQLDTNRQQEARRLAEEQRRKQADAKARAEAEVCVKEADELQRQDQLDAALSKYLAADTYFKGSLPKLSAQIDQVKQAQVAEAEARRLEEEQRRKQADAKARAEAEACVKEADELQRQDQLDAALSKYLAADTYFKGALPKLSALIQSVHKQKAESQMKDGAELERQFRLEEAVSTYRAAEQHFGQSQGTPQGAHTAIDRCQKAIARRKQLGVPVTATDTECDARESQLKAEAAAAQEAARLEAARIQAEVAAAHAAKRRRLHVGFIVLWLALSVLVLGLTGGVSAAQAILYEVGVVVYVFGLALCLVERRSVCTDDNLGMQLLEAGTSVGGHGSKPKSEHEYRWRPNLCAKISVWVGVPLVLLGIFITFRHSGRGNCVGDIVDENYLSPQTPPCDLCADGWAGTHCETEIPYCDWNKDTDCGFGGQCTSSGRTEYSCVCEKGWMRSAVTDLHSACTLRDPCLYPRPVSCGAHGSCDSRNEGRCSICKDGYSGSSCNISPPHFEVRSGPCTLSEGGRCVGRWPGGYGPNEDCEIVVAGGGGGGGGGAARGVLGGCPVFDIQSSDFYDDLLTLPDGSRHHGADCPAGAVLAAGQSLAWHSSTRWQGNNPQGNGLPQSHDGLGGGWQVCFAKSNHTAGMRAGAYACMIYGASA